MKIMPQSQNLISPINLFMQYIISCFIIKDQIVTRTHFRKIHPYRNTDSELTKLMPCCKNGFFVSNHALHATVTKIQMGRIRCIVNKKATFGHINAPPSHHL